MSAMVLPRATRVALHHAAAVVGAATLLALALRFAAARGDVGFDEVWSMRLVERVDGLGGVLWGISHDNNHFLNSMWLHWVGAGAPVWLWRLPAVVLGTLTVPALALCCGRRDPVAGAVAALLGAVVLPFVDFGSEARGYAGLVLATAVAFDAAGCAGEAVAAGRRDRAAAWRLGLAAGFGAMCHLTMLLTMAVVGAALLIRTGVHRRPAAALRESAAVLLPSGLLVLPALGCVLAGVVVRGRFTVGNVDPFALDKLVSGFGEMVLDAAGLPDSLPRLLGLGAAAALLAVAARARLAAPWTLAVGVAALVALPLAVAALRPPNVAHARYYAVSGVAVVVLLAETLATLWGRPGDRRAAVLAIAAILAGALAADAGAIRAGRTASGATLAIIASEPPGAASSDVASNLPIMAGMLLGEAARRAGIEPPAVVAESAPCASPPGWYLAIGVIDEREAVEIGPPACRTRLVLRFRSWTSPLSGTGWTLYRRA